MSGKSESKAKCRVRKDFLKILDEEAVMHEAVLSGVVEVEGVSGDDAFRLLVNELTYKQRENMKKRHTL